MSKSFIIYMEKLYDYCQKIRIQREKILISVYKNFHYCPLKMDKVKN